MLGILLSVLNLKQQNRHSISSAQTGQVVKGKSQRNSPFSVSFDGLCLATRGRIPTTKRGIGSRKEVFFHRMLELLDMNA